MRKELAWAIILSVTFGAVVAFGIWRVNSSIKPNAAKTSATPVPEKNTSEFKITLDKPENYDVVTEDSISISGLTKPLTWIVMSGEEYDYIVQPGADGVFAQEVDLVSGVNQIKLTAFDPEGNQSIETLLVVYSSSFQKNQTDTDSSQTTATSDSEIRAKVQEKVQAALNKPKAYIGTITDISDSTIQIKSSKSEIQQISTVNEDLVVANTMGTANRNIKLTDIAIGDFIVAMGYVNGNSVLIAQRILISDAVTNPEVTVGLGNVSDTGRNTIEVAGVDGKSSASITTDSKTLVFVSDDEGFVKGRISDISEGDLLIYSSTSESGTKPVRTIFILQSSENEDS